ncbi:glycogen debranching protein GlgX [Actinomyces bowdenii]|uniref:Glycogen debranching protein GlgX n=1 Tax=Actinomyces bowdenii TaxID=131109 RepID=A0A853ENK1_9ACTO|nr:glycogen debranching protein GlgX [Actinomyces bowdenii]MBF0697709.1 glycogen debranching protein GlgX [Actinomyces bowdenii]MDO5063738.1 glycogen debranching protein GlgX [Actinomyces bowdenii]NYS69882.1 glycogen debranching protein GlgX [Actinomyces bowdenii]
MSTTPPALLPAPRAEHDASARHTLGAVLTGDGADFVVHASHASAVDLCLLTTDAQGRIVEETRVGMHGPRRGTWGAHVPGVRAGQRYGYRVHGQWAPHEGLLHNPRKLLLDPYARALDGQVRLGPEIYAHEVTEDLSPIGEHWQPSGLDSAGSTALGVVTGQGFAVVPGPRIPRERTIVYEAHVKGLTHDLPGVPEHLRGTYAGLAHSATVEHLKKLGVTTIELLPIHAAFTEPFLAKKGLTNYWGYSTLSYFAPEPSYATAASQAAGPQAVLDEVRGMVSILHEAGLEVVLDVVYNHTCEGGMDGPSLSLRGLDNLDYYLHGPHRPAQYVDVTGTGNTVDFRSSRAVQLALDSLRYWAGEVGVDGFRFDLAVTLGRHASEFTSRHPLLVAMASDPILSGVKLITEPWDVGPGGWRTGQFPEPFQDWNDHFRDTVRSFWLHDASEMSKGRLGSDLRDLATRLAGSADLFGYGEYPGGRGPLGSVNFITAHDGFSLRDLVSYDHKHNLANKEDNRDGSNNNRSWNHGHEGPVVEGMNQGPIEVLRRRSMRNMMGTLLLSAGTPMLTGGDELGRTQEGNNNCYCQDSPLSWVNWDLETWQRDMVATTRFLIHMRHAHPVVRPDRFATGQVLEGDTIPDLSWFGGDGEQIDAVSWHDPHVRVVQMLRSGHPWGDQDLLVIVNGSLDQAEVLLPDAHGTDWHLAWDSSWSVPQPHTSPFSMARRVSRPSPEPGAEAAGARASGGQEGRQAPTAVHNCRQDRPGDVTSLDALSLRVYFSGEPLQTLAPSGPAD